MLGQAPDFTGTQRWFNTPGGKPLTLAGLRGRVVLVDFWTYTCINCLRTFPYVRAWDAAYRDRGLTIVGVHTPEFRFERDAGNVRDAIAQNKLRYPVAQDNEFATWNAWGNQYWPAKYLIDAKGRVRYVHFGEGDDDKTEAAIRSLLAEAGAERLGGDARVGAAETAGPGGARPRPTSAPRAPSAGCRRPRRTARTPTAARAAGCPRATSRSAGAGASTTSPPRRCAARALDARVVGKAVYLVLSSRGDRPRTLQVRLDGRPIRADRGGRRRPRRPRHRAPPAAVPARLAPEGRGAPA